VRALGPGIASGLVRLHGVDPKGGELYPGRAMLTGYADDTTDQMAALLERAVEQMTARKHRLKAKGQRVFVPSTTDPWWSWSWTSWRS
jgi:S-DNA-T family DNA segregation ATPase FtsK/SpoIIIE